MNETVAIIIPTWNNPDYLYPCVMSILEHQVAENLFKIYVVDNGTEIRVKEYLPKEVQDQIVIIEPGENLGWEGGLKLGLKVIPKEVPFIMFLNDDTYIPFSSRFWLHKMIQWFRYPTVGAVGPMSNVVMGIQNIFSPMNKLASGTHLLIGFCMLLRREALEKAGGVDDTLPGGDDFDLSIRLEDVGYEMIVDRAVFVFHHGFKTGERLHGNANVGGGWNSWEMYEKVNHALIEKHGFARWQQLMVTIGTYTDPNGVIESQDGEGKLIQEMGFKGKIYELGCGATLTYPSAIGVDVVPKGQRIGTIDGVSVAEIVADVSQPLPFKNADVLIARHILEHMGEPIQTLRNWGDALKEGGTLVVAVPNEELNLTIPMNIEHKNSFTPHSLTDYMKAAGFTNIEALDPKNGVSFVIKGNKE